MKVGLKKTVKIILLVLLLVFGGFIYMFFKFSQPKSDAQILAEFEEKSTDVYLNYRKFKDYSYRVLNFQKELDTSRYNLVFVHGSIGSAMDFRSYCTDSVLLNSANIRSYDRIGYGLNQTGETLNSIAMETLHFEQVIADMDSDKTILVGYSYGGPIVLNAKGDYKKIVLIAPAVHSQSEPMPWAINFYKWNITRWLLPKTWQGASKEKLTHREDLLSFEDLWKNNKSSILSIHGNSDGIVPIENSIFLKEKFSSKQFEMLTLDGVGHGLVWSQSDTILSILQQEVN